MNDIIQLFY